MHIHRLSHTRVNHVLVLALIVNATMSFGVACSLLEASAPERSFVPEDLLLDQSEMPSVWTDAWGPFLPEGDDLFTRESVAIQFGVAGRESPIQAEQAVYRYRTLETAQRTFASEYLPQVSHLKSVPSWTYRSDIAEQSFFGCHDWEGRATPVCEWAGMYDEYIVVFRAHMTADEVSLADIEAIIGAIDERMAQYLEKAATPHPGQND